MNFIDVLTDIFAVIMMGCFTIIVLIATGFFVYIAWEGLSTVIRDYRRGKR